MNTLAALNVISSQDQPAHSSLASNFPRRNDKFQRMDAGTAESEGDVLDLKHIPTRPTSERRGNNKEARTAARRVATGLELLC